MENFFNEFLAGEWVSHAYENIKDLLEAIEAIHKPIYESRINGLDEIDGIDAFPILFQNQYPNLENENESALEAELLKFIEENEYDEQAVFAFCVTSETIAIQVFPTIDDYLEDKDAFADITAMFYDEIDEPEPVEITKED